MSKKPIAELLRKHLPNVTVENGWFGRVNFSDPASGLKGHIFRENIDFKAKDPSVKAAAYLPLSRFAVEAYTSAPNSLDEELREFLIEHLAKMWRLKDKWHLRKLWSPVLSKAEKEKRVARERIVWHLDKFGLKSVRRKFLGGYDVTMDSGRGIVFSRSGLDFPKPSNTLLSTEDEDFALRFECHHMANTVWGGFRYSNLKGQELIDASAFAEKCGFTVEDHRLVVMKHFGAAAAIKYSWGGLKISVPNVGYVKVECGAIEKVCGDLLRPALAMAHEVSRREVVVRGKAELLVMAMHEANGLGISVIPESDMELFNGIFVNAFVLSISVLAFQWLDWWQALLAGYIGGLFLCMLIFQLFGKQLRDMARRKGLEIVRFEIKTTGRRASIDQARKQGLL